MFRATSIQADVAQLVRASDCGSEGRWFESTRLYHFSHISCFCLAIRADHPSAALASWRISAVPALIALPDGSNNALKVKACAVGP